MRLRPRPRPETLAGTVGLSSSLLGRKRHSDKHQKTENVVDWVPSLHDEDKTETQVKTETPAAGPVTHSRK